MINVEMTKPSSNIYADCCGVAHELFPDIYVNLLQTPIFVFLFLTRVQLSKHVLQPCISSQSKQSGGRYDSVIGGV